MSDAVARPGGLVCAGHAPARSRGRQGGRSPGRYEEYHPFGSTAWWAGSGATVSQKRYRYTGMEKDDETGLSYHHHRYYATWLGRWTSSDPQGTADGPNRYAFVGDNPMRLRDPTGLGAWAGIYDAVSTWSEDTMLARAQKAAMLVVAGAGKGADVAVEALANPVQTASAMGSVLPPVTAYNASQQAGGGMAGAGAAAKSMARSNVEVPIALAVGAVSSLGTAARAGQDQIELAHRIVTGNATFGESLRAQVGGATGLTSGKVATLEQKTAMTVESAGAAAELALTAGVAEGLGKPRLGRDGTLSPREVGEIQAIVDKYGTRVDVVGSRAKGRGRNISNTDLPHGKGQYSRSDIDFKINALHPDWEELVFDLAGVGDSVGTAGSKWAYAGGSKPKPTYPPYIRFEPGSTPYLHTAPASSARWAAGVSLGGAAFADWE